jgi:predicted PurR-regulated permease PerM
VAATIEHRRRTTAAAAAVGRDRLSRAESRGEAAPPEPPDEPVAVPDSWFTWRSGVVIIASASLMYLLQWASQVFIPIVLSILISYALEPMVRRMMWLRIPRMVASAVVVLALAGSVGYSAYTLSDDVTALVAEIPEAAQKLRQVVRDGRGDPGAIQQVQQAAEELQQAANEASGPSSAPRGVQRVQVEEPAVNIRQYLMWGPAGLLSFSMQAVLILFFVFFLLASGDLFKRKIVRIAGPSLARRKITVQILDDINHQIERLLQVYAIDSLLVAVISWLAFRALGLQQAALWGIAAGVFNNIPYFGPIIVSAGIAVVAFVQFGVIATALWIAGIAFLITALEGWLIFPWLTSRAARTNEVAVFVGLIFWTFVWGIWGTLLAMPMMVVAKACCDRIEDLKPIGELLGD